MTRKNASPYGDIKYFHQVHINKMKKSGLIPVDYSAFSSRLCRGMSLHDAINTPRIKGVRIEPAMITKATVNQKSIFDTPKKNRIRRPVKRTLWHRLLKRLRIR